MVQYFYFKNSKIEDFSQRDTTVVNAYDASRVRVNNTVSTSGIDNSALSVSNDKMVKQD